MIAAALALTFALGGTAIAADPLAKLTKAKVRAIAKKEIDKRAPGLSVSKAKSADTAAEAANAAKLGGINPSQFLRGDVCQQGTVLGFARFDPSAMVAEPTYSTSGVSVPRNCAGGTVEASRIQTGQYRIRFNGLGAAITICNVEADGDGAPPITVIAPSLIALGHWRVHQFNAAVHSAEDEMFACIVP